MSTGTPGAVFDAMVFLQAMANDQGPAFACQRLVDEGKLTLFVSPAVLEEAEDVANRPHLRRKFKNLTPKTYKRSLKTCVPWRSWLLTFRAFSLTRAIRMTNRMSIWRSRPVPNTSLAGTMTSWT
jgi:hypothetical protein